MGARVVIVGASLGGLRSLEALASAGVDPRCVTICGAEDERPYNRPPLSKDVLATIGETGRAAAFAKTAFRVKPELEAATWLMGRSAVSVSLANRIVRLSDGSELAYDALIVATGLTPRRLPLEGAWPQRFVLRTLDDTARLRACLAPGTHVVVAGGGFIGCEVAATAKRLGCHVTIVEPLAEPMERAIGREAGAAMRMLHEARGVSFRRGASVTSWQMPSPGVLTGVELSTGEVIPASIVVEAVGSVANTQWLEGQGLDLSNGLLCDNWMRVEGRSDLYAVGDVARFPNPLFDGECRRVEHWCVPSQTAKRAAETLSAHLSDGPLSPGPFRPMPSFWSDQHGIRIQSLGLPGIADSLEVLEGSLGSAHGIEAGVAVGYMRNGHRVGVVTFGMTPGRALDHRGYLDVEQPRSVL